MAPLIGGAAPISTALAEWMAGQVGLEATWFVHAVAMLVVATVALLVLITPIGLAGVYIERKFAGRMQNRRGPNRVGPWGILQPVADGIKLLCQEDIVSPMTDAPIFRMAPYVVFMAAFAGFAVIPFGPGLWGADLDVGIIFFLSMIGLETVGIVMAGWSSNNKWSLLGAMREVAQVVSYELPLGLSAMAPVIAAGSLSLVSITDAQQGHIFNWFIVKDGYWAIVMVPCFLVWCVSALAAAKRAPFDLPEAESELVAGFHTEYSGMRFGMFFLPEYAVMLSLSAVGTVLFLGGYHDPFGLSAEGGAMHGVWWWGLLWFVGKAIVQWLVIICLRWTLPRMRIDHVMYLCYKVLLPVSMATVVVTALFKLIGGA
ncbi:MAG: NADH-quinone oxidoreductase subunit NuoH [Planctomycetota bacterium]|jgi:NADH-quinone oxidoreductase subunit H